MNPVLIRLFHLSRNAVHSKLRTMKNFVMMMPRLLLQFKAR
jgi:hypothetical protein